MNSIGLNDIDRLTAGRLGTYDTVCPLCSHLRHSAKNRSAKVLRVWRKEAAFASYCCAHCGESGYTFDRNRTPPDPAKIIKAKAEATEHDRSHRADRLGKAQWLWAQSRPIVGTIAETYLRGPRGYGGPLPATLRFLPARGDYAPAMIGAFGMAHEVDLGVIAIAVDAIRGVHVTRLLPDGSGKAGSDKDKIMVGLSAGWPLVVAPPNDLLGMAVAEGIEDALSAHEATGLGAWAVGGAKRMPALAERIPSYIDCITVFCDDDADGIRFAAGFAKICRDRGIETYRIIIDQPWRSQLWAPQSARRQRREAQTGL
jgi:hypothetical protein